FNGQSSYELTVPAGQSGASVFAKTTPVLLNTSVSFTADGVSTASPLTVLAPVPVSCAVSPTSAYGGLAPATGSFTLSGPAPAGFTVSLSSSNGAAYVPVSMVFASAGATSGAFSVGTNPVASTTDVMLQASYDPDGSGPGGYVS